MDNTTRQYEVSFFPCSEVESGISSTVHMELRGDFEKFLKRVSGWLEGFKKAASSSPDGMSIYLTCDGEDDGLILRREEEIILSLLYCCDRPGVAVTEISYKGDRYTDISHIRFLKGSGDEAHEGFFTHPVRLYAKKNGHDSLVYIFGPYIRDFNCETVQIGRYPLSSGMVGTAEDQIYAGAHPFKEWNLEDDCLPDVPTVVSEGVHVFLTSDAKGLTFSALLDGRLYKKISRDEEKIIFYSVVLLDGSLVSKGRFWSNHNRQNAVFENVGGEYLYLERDGDAAPGQSGAAFPPPLPPDAASMSQNRAYSLCQSYVEALYALFPPAQCKGDTIWEEFLKILEDIHDGNGLDSVVEWVQPAEALYAACIFFSLEEKELEGFLTTRKLRKEYELLKRSAEDLLNLYAAPDVFVFREMREIFACDFPYINQVVGSFGVRNEAIPIPYTDIAEGLVPEYNVILLFIKAAGASFYFSDAECRTRKTEVSSIIQYYRAKHLPEAGSGLWKKDIDAVMAMRTDLREQLRLRVKGQDMAIDKFVDGYIRYGFRGKVHGKPAGLYLFAGPPGTGKTYLAEVFAELVAKEGYGYRRFEMAAYGGGGSDAVSGLVGFEKTWKTAQPGQLTGFVKSNPKCVLLFDEIEKASAQVRYLFLSVLEGAVLTDKYYDEPVSFEDAILIFTTNEGRDLYEDNRGTNLAALPDSAVMEGLQASKFAPELISRFMSGTIVMFNHLGYLHMSDIFEASMNAAVSQICKNSVNFDFHYGPELPKLYLLSKGSNIDARFVSANAKKMTEDCFLEAMDSIKKQHGGSLKELKEAIISVRMTDDVREYFEPTHRPRILGYAKESAEVYTGQIAGLHDGAGLEGLSQRADCEWARDAKSFAKALQGCNWNSSRREDRYDAILIDLGENPEDGPIGQDAAEGYACLKAAAGEKPGIPIILVDRGAMEEKASLMALGATDFLQGASRGQAGHGSEECAPDTAVGEGLVLDREGLAAILDRQHFLEMAEALAKKGQRLSGTAAYDYEAESGRLKICFRNLHVKAAEEEDAEARRQNRQYLLEDRPQVRLQDIFGSELVKKVVRRCIDNIRNPEKYRSAGAKLMKGILMYGAPGMGKTMFAKAMAYESKASFISAVGSDFLNGNGIARLEEMFQTARRKKPCILFIDEFDAISKSRGGLITSYQESLLEKFLKEMDGLETDNDGVYVVGATNYSLEGLDSAVTRRFSARIYFPYPNMEEREKFLLHLLEEKKLKDRISERAAKTLNRMMYRRMRSYAEIEAFIEESIAEAVYSDTAVTERFLFKRMHDDRDGAARQETGREKLMAVAFHEAGHAVLQNHFGMKNDYVTIISRGDYGGYAMAEHRYYSRQDFLDQICISFAGRAAEMKAMELYPEMADWMGINVGAGSDLQSATHIAYDYVCRYGLGGRFIVVPEIFAPQAGGCPEAMLPEAEKEAIWKSINQILEQQWTRTEQLLESCWHQVLPLAFSLIYMQELDGRIVEKIIQEQVPHVEESCFWDFDDDYRTMELDGEEVGIPFGYPIYPYSQIKIQPEDDDMAEPEDRQYFYAVKKPKEGLGIYRNLQEAFAEAFKRNASCRRFRSEEAAREHLEMLEMKAVRQGGNRFYRFSVDALTEMDDSSAAVKYITILKGTVIDRLREKADEAGKPMAQCLMEDIAEKALDDHEDIFLVIQIYDEALRDELLSYMDAVEAQAEGYGGNE